MIFKRDQLSDEKPGWTIEVMEEGEFNPVGYQALHDVIEYDGERVERFVLWRRDASDNEYEFRLHLFCDGRVKTQIWGHVRCWADPNAKHIKIWMNATDDEDFGKEG